LTKRYFEKIVEAKIREVDVLFIDNVTTSDSIRKTLLLDKVETTEDALLEIYQEVAAQQSPDR
jgi:DNA-directed RNA polymerase subunit beta